MRWWSPDWQEGEVKEGSAAQRPQVERRVGDTVQPDSRAARLDFILSAMANSLRV